MSDEDMMILQVLSLEESSIGRAVRAALREIRDGSRPMCTCEPGKHTDEQCASNKTAKGWHHSAWREWVLHNNTFEALDRLCTALNSGAEPTQDDVRAAISQIRMAQQVLADRRGSKHPGQDNDLPF